MSAFRMYVQDAVDLKYLKLGEAVELRTHFEVVAPSDLQAEDGGDRPWGSAISFGVHSPFHYGPLHMSLGADVHFIGKKFWFDAVSAGPSQRVRNQTSR